MAERRGTVGLETTDAPWPLADDASTVDGHPGQLLSLHAVRKSWKQKSVLEGVDLSVAKGEFVFISGANGTGKTTLLRIAAGLIHADSGHVAIDGLHPERDRRAYLARLGFLPAGDRGLYARLSARRHLDLWARLSLVPPRRRDLAVESAVNVFELDDYADRRVDRLSAGQRQRVRLAMSLVHNPEVILLDEPANSLDHEGLQALIRYLELVRDHGAAVVWCAPEGTEKHQTDATSLRLSEGRLWPA